MHSNQLQEETRRVITNHIDLKIKELLTYSRRPLPQEFRRKREPEYDVEVIFHSQILQGSACYDGEMLFFFLLVQWVTKKMFKAR